MKQIKRKETKFMKFSRRLLILSFIVFVVGVVTLNSYESTLNINCDKLEKEISTIESDIDGLDMKKLELTAFSRLSTVLTKNGYTYKQNIATAAVIGVQRD
ncbi:MAG: hypothetical protein RR585_00250 [Coprobacillus sp.]